MSNQEKTIVKEYEREVCGDISVIVKLIKSQQSVDEFIYMTTFAIDTGKEILEAGYVDLMFKSGEFVRTEVALRPIVYRCSDSETQHNFFQATKYINEIMEETSRLSEKDFNIELSY